MAILTSNTFDTQRDYSCRSSVFFKIGNRQFFIRHIRYSNRKIQAGAADLLQAFEHNSYN